jgi:hypothetical protein
VDIKVRIWAENDEFPDGKMYYPHTMADEVAGHRGFYLNQFGDVLHGRQLNHKDATHALVWARIGYNGITKMLSSGVSRSGREIYALDIIEYSFGTGRRTGVVYFDEGCFRVDGFLLKDLPEDSEVMGNIKENPELVGMEELTWNK